MLPCMHCSLLTESIFMHGWLKQNSIREWAGTWIRSNSDIYVVGSSAPWLRWTHCKSRVRNSIFHVPAKACFSCACKSVFFVCLFAIGSLWITCSMQGSEDCCNRLSRLCIDFELAFERLTFWLCIDFGLQESGILFYFWPFTYCIPGTLISANAVRRFTHIFVPVTSPHIGYFSPLANECHFPGNLTSVYCLFLCHAQIWEHATALTCTDNCGKSSVMVALACKVQDAWWILFSLISVDFTAISKAISLKDFHQLSAIYPGFQPCEQHRCVCDTTDKSHIYIATLYMLV